MKVVIACVLSLVVSGWSKPYYGEFLRVPRSHGYGSYAIAPCASAGAYHPALPAYHAPSSYGHASYGLGPVGYPHAQIGGYGGGYGAPHYRADDMEENTGEEPEMMSLSEMEPSENAPEARYVSLGGGYGAIGGGYGAPHAVSAIAPASPGAVGVFPGAHVSGCNVPLLLSCSPSIVPGRIVSHGSPHYAAPAYSAPVAAAGAYRSEAEPTQPTHDQTPSEHHAEPAAHATTVHESTKISQTRSQ